MKAPELDSLNGERLFHEQATTEPGGPSRLVELASDQAGREIKGGVGDRFVRMQSTLGEFALSVAECAKDGAGRAWALELVGQLRIMDPQLLLAALGPLAQPAVNRELAARWLAEQLGPAIRDVVREELARAGSRFESVRDDERLPGAFWENDARLPRWLVGVGLSLRHVRVRWMCAAAEQEEVDRRARMELERRQEQHRKEAALHARHERLQADAARELAQAKEELQRLNLEQECADKARQNELARHEMELRRKHLEAEHRLKVQEESQSQEMADLRRKGELAVVQHQAAIAALQNHAETDRLRAEVDRLSKELEQAQRASVSPTQRSPTLRDDYQKTLQLLDNPRLIELLGSRVPSRVNEGAALALRAGYRVQHLLSAGYDTHKLTIGLFTQKQLEEDGRVQLSMEKLRTRDVVCGAARISVDGLSIGTKLKFKLTSNRAGHVTVINAGTSGRFWLLVPSAGARSARISRERNYDLPGEELLPASWSGPLEEGGPSGEWEHVIAIVSDEPLLAPEFLEDRFRHFGRGDLLELTIPELAEVHRRLAKWPESAWSAGVVSFEVLPA
jgi:hypothetical protein